MKYIVYAIKDNGDGYVSEVGRYDDLWEIQLRVGMFADDVVLEIVQKDEDE